MPISQEYKRTCRQCGKVWHSLLVREQQLQTNIKSNQCDEKINCCDYNPRLQAERNRQATESEIDRLRKCPNCSSKDFSQEIITIETP
jgi:hypothetical protein